MSLGTQRRGPARAPTISQRCRHWPTDYINVGQRGARPGRIRLARAVADGTHPRERRSLGEARARRRPTAGQKPISQAAERRPSAHTLARCGTLAVGGNGDTAHRRGIDPDFTMPSSVELRPSTRTTCHRATCRLRTVPREPAESVRTAAANVPRPPGSPRSRNVSNRGDAVIVPIRTMRAEASRLSSDQQTPARPIGSPVVDPHLLATRPLGVTGLRTGDRRRTRARAPADRRAEGVAPDACRGRLTASPSPAEVGAYFFHCNPISPCRAAASLPGQFRGKRSRLGTRRPTSGIGAASTVRHGTRATDWQARQPILQPAAPNTWARQRHPAPAARRICRSSPTVLTEQPPGRGRRSRR